MDLLDLARRHDGDAFTSRFLVDGSNIWTQRHGEVDTGHQANAIGTDSSGDVYIAGDIYLQNFDSISWAFQVTDFFLTKYSEE